MKVISQSSVCLNATTEVFLKFPVCPENDQRMIREIVLEFPVCSDMNMKVVSQYSVCPDATTEVVSELIFYPDVTKKVIPNFPELLAPPRLPVSPVPPWRLPILPASPWSPAPHWPSCPAPGHLPSLPGWILGGGNTVTILIHHHQLH